MSGLLRFLPHQVGNFITQLLLGALLVGAIDATLLWDVMRHIPPDDGLDALGVMLTVMWFMVAAWSIMTWRNNRRDDRRGGGDPPSEKYPPRGPGGRAIAQPLHHTDEHAPFRI